ncbi:MAG TPA: nitrogenase component 1, partial [Spirochaetota bacterium]|nr:nitrogenase component 1 [Spirochaetota bacterium]
TREEIVSMGDSQFTIGFGRVSSLNAAKLLDTQCKVPYEMLDLPVGIRNTDAYIDLLRKIGGVSVPESLTLERGQLVDVMTDMQQYTYRKKAALVGDPDLLIGLVSFLTELDVEITTVLTGTPAGPKFERRIRELAGDKVIVKQGLN